MAKKYWVMGTGEESILITESSSMLKRKLHELLSSIFKYSSVLNVLSSKQFLQEYEVL